MSERLHPPTLGSCCRRRIDRGRFYVRRRSIFVLRYVAHQEVAAAKRKQPNTLKIKVPRPDLSTQTYCPCGWPPDVPHMPLPPEPAKICRPLGVTRRVVLLLPALNLFEMKPSPDTRPARGGEATSCTGGEWVGNSATEAHVASALRCK